MSQIIQGIEEEIKAQVNEFGLIENPDGSLWDPDTGEIIESQKAPTRAMPDVEIEDFVKTRMLCFRNVDREIQFAKGMKELWTKRVNVLENRRKWFWQLWGELILGVASRLRGEKDRFVVIGAGKVVYTNSPKGSIKVVDEERALVFARQYFPAAIVVKESVGVSLIPDEDRQRLFVNPDIAAMGFEVEAPGERSKVETG